MTKTERMEKIRKDGVDLLEKLERSIQPFVAPDDVAEVIEYVKSLLAECEEAR